MDKLIDDLIKLAFAEDIGDGDHTTLCCIPETAMGKSQLIIKEDGVLAGVEMAKRIFHDFDPELKMTVFIQDGAEVKKGDIAFVVEGKIQSLLQTERLMLNVMQRMSGIATTTRKYAKALEGTKTHVLDTRKTTPGMRMIEKEAVRIGGGMNHRIGLFDMILLKDNHVDFAGGIEQAITRAQNYLKEKGKSLKIEIEVRNFDELEQAMKVGGIDRIMLDNFNIENTKEAVRRINGRFEVESSGPCPRRSGYPRSRRRCSNSRPRPARSARRSKGTAPPSDRPRNRSRHCSLPSPDRPGSALSRRYQSPASGASSGRRRRCARRPPVP